MRIGLHQKNFLRAQSLTIDKGEVAVYELQLEPAVKLKPGIYSGNLVFTEKESIKGPSLDLQILVGQPDLIFLGKEKTVDFEFHGTRPNRTGFKVSVENKGNGSASLNWKINIPNLRCTKGAHPTTSPWRLLNNGSPEGTKPKIQAKEAKIFQFGLTKGICLKSKAPLPIATFEPGTYEGSLVLEVIGNQQVLEQKLTMIVPEALSTDQFVVAWIQRLFQAGLHTAMPLGTYSWFFLGLLLLILVPYVSKRILRKLWHWLGRPYTVNIDTIQEVSTSAKDQGKAIIALIRESLADCGSVPASVAPGVSIVQNAIEAVGEVTTVPQGKGIQQIAKYLVSQFSYKPGYSVTGTLDVKDSPKKI